MVIELGAAVAVKVPRGTVFGVIRTREPAPAPATGTVIVPATNVATPEGRTLGEMDVKGVKICDTLIYN